jgi:PAS domain S-box-containing protein
MTNRIALDFDLFADFSEMCFILSANAEIITSNKCADIKLDTLAGKLAGRDFFSLIDPEYREKTRIAFTGCFIEGKSSTIFSKFNAAGNIYDVNLFFTLIKQNSGSPGKLCMVMARDITEERKKELDLLKFYYVAENTVNPLQITDLQGKMIYVNPAFVAASGYSQKELLGKSPVIFGSGKHSKKFWSKMWNTITGGKVWVGEVENRKKSGEPFYTQLLISPILDHEGKVSGFFGIHRDLGEKKMLEKQLIHTQKMESIGTLAAGIAHEVGNPLASISALVQVVQRSTSDNFIKEKLELVKSQVTRISKIIRDLVDFSRPSNYELQLTDINANITEAVEITKVGSKAKNIQFKLELDREIPLLPLISDQIQQVFVNILLNAVDAILETDKEEKSISVSSEIEEDNVVIQFRDTGSGISEQNLGKIFEPFFTTKKEGRGTGLGLWVSYGIIKSFQGNIKVNSTKGKGTQFTITLPIQS